MTNSFTARLRAAAFAAVCALLPLSAAAQSSPDGGVALATPDGGLAAPDLREAQTIGRGDENLPPIGDENLPPIADEPPRARTGIVGRVIDDSLHEGAIEAPVIVVGTERRTRTDLDGNFALELPPGTYTLRSYQGGLQPARMENVVVRQGESTRVEIVLRATPRSRPQEVVVTARAQTGTAAGNLQQRRDSAGVSDGVSAQEIQRSPDQSAGDAIRRVVGASIVGGQYAYIRGLGGRYVNVTLNGMPLPSLDPDVPGVQLDLFPSALLNSLNIVKTFSPDLPGDFAGGQLQIATRDFPARLTLNATLSVGGDSLTHTGPVLGYAGGGTDFLGVDDGTRRLPTSVPGTRATDPPVPAAQLGAMSRGFADRWNVTRGAALPNLQAGVSVGNTVRVGGRPLGMLFSLSYQLNTRRQVEDVATVGNEGDAAHPQYVRRNDFTRDRNPAWGQENTTETALWGALASLNLQPAPNHELSLTAMWNQSATDFTNYRTGFLESVSDTVAERQMRFVQRSLFFAQLAGDHREMGGTSHVRARWQLFANVAERYEPDTRGMQYVTGGSAPTLINDRSATFRLFQDLGQVEVGGSADVQANLARSFTVRAGAMVRYASRQFDLRRFSIEDRRADSSRRRLDAPESYLDASNFNDLFHYAESTEPADGYRGTQLLGAPFVRADLNLANDKLRLMAGVRVEVFRQTLAQRSAYAADNSVFPAPVERTDVNPLPAFSATWALSRSMNLRAAYGATVARPILRELASVPYFDFVRTRLVYGLGSLQSTTIHSADLRWEWFLGATEVLAASAFYKYFDAPIEQRLELNNANVSFYNADSAQTFGGELEARFGLGRLARSLDFVQLGANVTVSYSRVATDPTRPGVDRPLIGQSPVLVNVNLALGREGFPLSGMLFYNAYGSRVEDVGRAGIPDVYQDPFHQLDAVVNWEVRPGLQLRLTARNLAYQAVVLRQGDLVVLRQSPATSLGLRLAWTY
ncbi:MAG: TonB-dependent receptor [Polyangiales bacterium]